MEWSWAPGCGWSLVLSLWHVWDGVVMRLFSAGVYEELCLNAVRRSTFCGHAARRPALRLSLVVPHLLLGAVPPSVGTLRVGLCP